jgi:hypothetical protein
MSEISALGKSNVFSGHVSDQYIIILREVDYSGSKMEERMQEEVGSFL